MLTTENIGKLQLEQKGKMTWPALKREVTNESTEVERESERNKSMDMTPRSSEERPRKERRWHDSERTVTDHER